MEHHRRATQWQSAVGGRAPVRSGSQLDQVVDLMRRNRDYRLLFASSVVSFLGDWFALVAVSGLVAELTGREGSTALVFAAEVLPIFLLSAVAGVLADRMDRKRLMIGSDLLRVLPALGLVAASVLGQAWLAYLCVVLISSLAAFFQPVVPAVVPNVVDRADLSVAQAALGSAWGSMLFIGAAVGGLAAATLGRNASFVINAATFLISAGLLWRVRAPFRRDDGTTVKAGASVFADLADVWRFVRPRKPVAALMVTKAGVGVGNGVVGLLPIYAVTVYEAGDAGIGVLLAGRGLGALLGPFVGRRLARDEGRKIVFWCGVSIVAYAAVYTLLPIAGGLWIAATIVTLAHIGGGNQWVASTHGLQLATPDAFRGRVMSLDFGLATMAMGISALVAGAVAEVAGLAQATYGLALFSLTYGLVWLVWTRDLWRAGADPLAADPLAPDPASPDTLAPPDQPPGPAS